MLGLGPEEDKLENGGHGGFLESFKVSPSPLPRARLKRAWGGQNICGVEHRARCAAGGRLAGGGWCQPQQEPQREVLGAEGGKVLPCQGEGVGWV